MRLSVAILLFVAALISGCNDSRDDNYTSGSSTSSAASTNSSASDTTSSGSNSSGSAAEAKAVSFDILHMNDIHSHLESESYDYTMQINGSSVKVGGQLGGMARAATKIKALQETYGENVLTINAGDLIQGTFYFSAFEGNATAAMFDQIGWDIFELGNHEFDNGDAFLGTVLDKFNPSVEILAANVIPDAGNVLENRWKPYTVKTIDGEKVGIIGIDIKQKTEVSSKPSPQIKFYDETTTAQQYIDELTAEGINKIILVTHVGYGNDLEMVSKLKGVDIVIGGDSHTLMGNFSAVGLTSVTTDYPKETADADGNKVCIAQAWQYSYVVGDLHVDFDADGKVTGCEGRETLLMGGPFQIDDADVNATTASAIEAIIAQHANLELVAEDAAASATLEPYKNEIDAKKSEVIGYAKSTLGHNRVPYDTYDGKHTLPFGSDIAPIVCASFMEEDPNADICIQNAGGVRIAVDEGNLTLDTAYTLLPFKNTLFEIEMKGSEIKQVIEDAMTNYLDNNGSTGSFPYAFAVRYDVNASRAANNRISNLEVMNKTTKTWSAIEADSMYTVITNNYTAEGHDGYVTFKTVQDERGLGTDTYLDYALSFVDYVKNHTASDGGIDRLPAGERPIKCYVDDMHPVCPEYLEAVPAQGSPLPYSVLRDDLEDGANPGHTFEIRNGGFGSAAFADPTNKNRFYAMTDRGPNATYTGTEGSGKKFPSEAYTPRIGLFEVAKDGSISMVKTILFKDPAGNPISGLPNSISLGGTGEIPYDADGNLITDNQGAIKTDDFGLDSEGLAVLNDGTFWVSDEYGPHMVHFDEDGKEIGRINPFSSDTRDIYNLPAEFANRWANRGMEGLTVTPDQKTLVGIMQSTLDNPSKAVRGTLTRIVTVNLENGTIKQYLYRQDKAKNSNSEITALGNDVFLVIERDGTFYKDTAEGQKYVYKIKLSTGTELESITLGSGMAQDDALGLVIDINDTAKTQTLEQVALLDNGWDLLAGKGIVPVQKELVVDMIKQVQYPHDKMEGLIVFDEHTLGIVNDDDFAMWETGGVLEQKYLDAAKKNIDGNTLYIVHDLNLSVE